MVRGKLSFVAALVALALNAKASPHPMDNNLVYRSLLSDHPIFGRDTLEIKKRFAKRQLADASPFTDEHYPTFYGGNFGNAEQVWASGIDFTHGVASGDPFDTSVLLWTRAFPKESSTPTNPSSTPNLPDQSIPVCVKFEIATDAKFKHVIDSGDAFTSYDVDFTVKVEAKGLIPETAYFYRFMDCTNSDDQSPVGKTRTIPEANTPAHKVNGGKPLVFAVFSCAQYQVGYFNAYGYGASKTDAHYAIHVGDYLYESTGNGAAINRTTLGRELATINDYRMRYAQYRTDQSLLELHRLLPTITVWDDHEVADNSWKAGTTDSNDTAAGCKFSPSGACFTDRKLAAVRAYHEWMPVRVVDTTDTLRIWRNFPIGKLMDLTMLDTRNYDRDVTGVGYNGVIRQHSLDENRSIMGKKQEEWFYDTLRESKTRGAVWRIVAQQVIMMQLNETAKPGGLSTDNWSGYKGNRNRILDLLDHEKIDNTIVLAGDSHDNWAFDGGRPNSTTYDPITGKGSLLVEFAGTAVTSGNNLALGMGATPENANKTCSTLLVAEDNEDLQWCEHGYRGFFTISVSSKLVETTYYAMTNVSNPNTDGFASATFTVLPGENRIHRPVAGGKVAAGVLKSQVLNMTAPKSSTSSNALAPSSTSSLNGTSATGSSNVTASSNVTTSSNVTASSSVAASSTASVTTTPATSG